MTEDADDRVPSDHLAETLKKVRRQRSWSTKALAERCAELGAPQITASVLMNIESGRKGNDGRRRRSVTVEELLALASALEVPPVDLLVPEDLADDGAYSITPELTVRASVARDWISGQGFLKTPETTAELAEAIRWMPQTRAGKVVRAWFTPERQREQLRATKEFEEMTSEAEEQKGDEG